jgi:hypothetical protein
MIFGKPTSWQILYHNYAGVRTQVYYDHTSLVDVLQEHKTEKRSLDAIVGARYFCHQYGKWRVISIEKVEKAIQVLLNPKEAVNG